MAREDLRRRQAEQARLAAEAIARRAEQQRLAEQAANNSQSGPEQPPNQQPAPPPSRTQPLDWTRMPGRLSAVEIAPDGEVWGLGLSGEMFVWAEQRWQQVPGQALSLAHGRDGRTWHVGVNHKLYVADRNGRGIGISRWAPVPGEASVLAGGGPVPRGGVWHLSKANNAAGGKNAFYGINATGWRKAPTVGNLADVALSALRGLALTTTGQVIPINSNGYPLNASPLRGIEASDITMSADGRTAWYLSKRKVASGGHAIFRSTYFRPGSSPARWEKIPGEMVQISAHPSNGSLWGVNALSEVWKYK